MGRQGRVHIVVKFKNTYAISAHHHSRCEFETRSWSGVLDATSYDKAYQWLATGRWFSLNTPASSTNKTDHHEKTEILVKVALNTITLNLISICSKYLYFHSINRIFLKLWIMFSGFYFCRTEHVPLCDLSKHNSDDFIFVFDNTPCLRVNQWHIQNWLNTC